MRQGRKILGVRLVADPARIVSRSVIIRLTWFQFHKLRTLFAQSVKYSLEFWNQKQRGETIPTLFICVIFILPNKVSVSWQPLPELFLGLSESDWLNSIFTDCGRILCIPWNIVVRLNTENLGWHNSFFWPSAQLYYQKIISFFRPSAQLNYQKIDENKKLAPVNPYRIQFFMGYSWKKNPLTSWFW